MKYSFTYLVEIQFLGFRFHGWQKQKDVLTIHEVIDKTLSFVLKGQVYKTMGIGRTDAKVSANKYYFQLFVQKELDMDVFLGLFKKNQVQDVSCKSIQLLPAGYNIINCDKIKEYHYYFSFNEVYHPFAAPFITNINEELDIKLMITGAKKFKGEHYFHKYCTKPSENTNLKRIIDSCCIEENTTFTASFFPKKSYVLKVKGRGFLRYQIRLIMGMLIELGKGNVSLNEIEESLLENNDRKHLRQIAPGSGLQLFAIKFK